MRNVLIALLLVSVSPTLIKAEGFERLKYNHPGLVVDLGTGLWAWPVPADADGDGDHAKSSRPLEVTLTASKVCP